MVQELCASKRAPLGHSAGERGYEGKEEGDTGAKTVHTGGVWEWRSIGERFKSHWEGERGEGSH